jgi:hypothetical protein
MKQKFAIIRDDTQNNLIVREYAELDKEMMSLLCEETYPITALQSAIESGSQAVISALRTNNMYPPTVFAQAIANAVEGLLTEDGNSSAELLFDDKELFNLEEQQAPEATDEEVEVESEEDVEVDDLLDDSIDDDFEDDKVLKDLKSSIQVADDDDSELDD